ncbi:MAG: hypothetical protein ACTSVO_15285 [Candidatus Heimdallarchaeaceae archaeon]
MIKLVLETAVIVAIVFGSLGFIISVVSILRTRVKGPIFVIPLVELETTWGVKTNDGRTFISIKPLIQNIGDRMSYLNIISIDLHVTVDNETSSSNSAEDLPFQGQFQSQTQTPKSFTIYMPKEAEEWDYGLLKIDGQYTDHKGNLKSFSFSYNLIPEARQKIFYHGRTMKVQISRNFADLVRRVSRNIPHDAEIRTIEPIDKKLIKNRQKVVEKNLKKKK